LVGPCAWLTRRTFRADNRSSGATGGTNTLVVVVADEAARTKRAGRSAAAVLHAIIIFDAFIVCAAERDIKFAAFLVGLAGFAGTQVTNTNIAMLGAAIGLDMKAMPTFDLLTGEGEATVTYSWVSAAVLTKNTLT
jgi:hypothetical protein